MVNLAQFKRFLATCAKEGTFFSFYYLELSNGSLITSRFEPSRQILTSNAKCFSFKRHPGRCWVDFGRAKSWVFGSGIAVRTETGINPQKTRVLVCIFKSQAPETGKRFG